MAGRSPVDDRLGETKVSLRVAATQFATGTDVAQNLATTLRHIDEAAARGAQLVVLPEFCNHPSWYDDHDHALRVACPLDGDFVASVADAARRNRVWVKWNATIRRDDGRITATNLLHDDGGALIAQADKLVLMGGERLHMSPAERAADVVVTPLGRLGLYSCMDGVIMEPPRLLAVQGAQLLLNSLNSFALDEASLHIPARAAENRVWVVAANKVGSLIPAEHLDAVSRALGVPPERLRGAGESQVVAPDGTAVARAPREGEAIVVADIDLARADDKRRPSGTDVMAVRRPEVYAALGKPGDGRAPEPGEAEAIVAVAHPKDDDDAAALTQRAVAAGARLVVLPPGRWSVATVTVVAEALGADAHAMIPLADDAGPFGALVDATGIVHRQRPLHASAQAPAATLADEVIVLRLPWGRLALLPGEDIVVPESVRLATLAGAEVVASPTDLLEEWEITTGVLERAAENRVNVVVASSSSLAGGVAATLTADFTLWTQWSKPFDGDINRPEHLVIPPNDRLTLVTTRPACAANKEISRETDLLAGRPWPLAGSLLT